ncbi:hypothetical protein SHIRM173S_04341 [Streptomyces hirsutus]
MDTLLAKLGPAAKLVEHTLRNSSNPTMLDAGYKVNVIPGQAEAYIDGRILPGGEDDFRATLDRLTGPDVDWEFHHREPALQSPADSTTFARMRAAVQEFAPEGHPVPYCMSGGTDAKQFSRLATTLATGSPLKLPEGFDYQALFHGVDERVWLEVLSTSASASSTGSCGRPEPMGETVRTLPYGEWPSPIDAATAAAHDGSPEYVGFVGDEVWWTEPRPAEGGRRTLVRRHSDGTEESVLPAPWNVRSRVHEYGGRPWAGFVRDDDPLVVFVDFADQRLYRYEPGGEPLPLTPASRGSRRCAAERCRRTAARCGASWRSSPATDPVTCAASWPPYRWTARPPTTAVPCAN